MTAIVMVSILVFPIVFLISLSVATQDVIIACGFALSTIFAFFVMFGPKAFALLFGKAEGTAIKSTSSAAIHPTYVPTTEVDKVNAVREKSGKLKLPAGPIVVASKALHGLTDDAKVALINEQMNGWRALLLKVNEHDSNGSS